MSNVLAIALNPAIDVACDAHNVRPTFKTRTWNQRHFAGGGGTNVARVISELGGAPELLYLSGGETGSLFEHCLSRHSIRSHRFEIEGSTRIALMVHEENTGFEYRFVPDGPRVEGAEIEPVHAFVENHHADYVVASGSLPRGAPADTYCRMADSVHRRGGRLVLDTSGDALKITLDQSHVFLLKPSMRELERLVGEELDQAGAGDAAASLIKRGAAENVVVSMGQQGAIFVNSDGVVRVPSIRVREKSAVGAGDSFVGAMVWSLMEGRSVLDAFRFGVAAGSAAVMTPGTELCRRADVLRLFQENFGKQSL
ncbi:1-phosphofructokinase family hexose kinase [Oricola cellulosilytica]|uniref:Phosphofructokinase n=1 Tax=Oricola cellulosilytica TaxID=1429082 RepID=A0A4R0P7I4_9HYPH|nr:1-phosphofructokinase family hexose kinase [Oricola cellulosilytica]TCD11884.1 1-phosphofructokinase family hexose kinase [Oricola cellulosilytica]